MLPLLFLLGVSSISGPVRENRELLVVHADGATPMDASAWRYWNVRPVAASKLTLNDLARENVALVGTPRSNQWIEKLAPERFQKWYGRPDYLVQIAEENPLNAAFRMFFVIGEIEGPLPPRRADVHIRRRGQTVLLGFRRDDGSFETRRFEPVETPQLVTEHFRFFVHGFEASLEKLRRLEGVGARKDVHVYRSLEEKGLITDDTRSAHVESGVFHIVLGVDDRPALLLAESGDGPLFLKQGRAAVRVYDSNKLDRLDETAREILATSDPPCLVELLDDARFQAESPFVTDALSASFVRFAKDEAHDVARLESAWASALRKKKPLPKTRFREPPAGFQHGITYAHEGYQIYNGYLSERSDETLAELAAMGIDAVAIVPYTFLGDPKRLGPLRVPRRSGSETDEDVMHVIRRARELGLRVLLKPQIWVRRSWPGEIEAANEPEEEFFFREYGHWIRHYALMAEALDVPYLSIGTELKKLTRGRRKRWQTLIEDVRKLYSGKLVYAANWGDEVEQVDFWDLLDFIGVDFYYPLSFDASPTDEALREGFEAALERLEKLHRRYQKPVLLTEIGYASTKSPWRKPHASDREREAAPGDQARAYEIAFESLSRETSWIRGMYWWKWPTDPGRADRDRRGFTPKGKPAEDVLRRWYDHRLH